MVSLHFVYLCKKKQKTLHLDDAFTPEGCRNYKPHVKPIENTTADIVFL